MVNIPLNGAAKFRTLQWRQVTVFIYLFQYIKWQHQFIKQSYLWSFKSGCGHRINRLVPRILQFSAVADLFKIPVYGQNLFNRGSFMNKSDLALVFVTTSLIIAGCSPAGSTSQTSEKSVQVQQSEAASSPSAVAIEEATRSPGQPAPQVREPSPEFAALPAPYNEASYAIGKRVFKLCSSCHTAAEGGPNLIGPNLHGLFGKQVGYSDGFPYSPALKDADFIWAPEKLDEWLASPRTFLPGNRMTFQGIRKPTDRQAVIAYLMVETGWQAAE